MKSEALNILLVEENQLNINLIDKYLSESVSTDWNLTTANRLVDGLGVLSLQPIDIVLMAYDLPDSMETAGVKLVQEHKPSIPLVILVEEGYSNNEIDFIEIGAQDYLLMGSFDPALLDKTLHIAITRQKLMTEHKKTIDELNARIEDLEKMNDLMVNREIVITNLKRELREIQKKIIP